MQYLYIFKKLRVGGNNIFDYLKQKRYFKNQQKVYFKMESPLRVLQDDTLKIVSSTWHHVYVWSPLDKILSSYIYVVLAGMALEVF